MQQNSLQLRVYNLIEQHMDGAVTSLFIYYCSGCIYLMLQPIEYHDIPGHLNLQHIYILVSLAIFLLVFFCLPSLAAGLSVIYSTPQSSKLGWKKFSSWVQFMCCNSCNCFQQFPPRVCFALRTECSIH